MAHRTIFFLLPVYNEGMAVERLLRKLQNAARASDWRYRIVVCDDGSTDGTSDVLRRLKDELPIDVLVHDVNQGLGETIKNLFRHIAGIVEDGDVVVRLDCDDTHEPGYVSAMIAKIDEGYDVVIASRFQEGGGQIGLSLYRSIISLVANLMLKLFNPLPGVLDYTCGFRAYRGAIIRRAQQVYGDSFIQIIGLGFTCTFEKLLKFKLLNSRMTEIPFVLRYDQKLGKSKMIVSATTLGYMVLTLLYHWPWGGWKSAFQNKFRDKAGNV